MVPIGVTDYDNKYSEFIVINNVIEPVGNWSVNLDDYVKKDELLFTAVSSDYFEVKNKTLSLKPIPMNAIVGLNELNENVVTLNTDVGVLRTDITNLKSVTSELQVATSELNTKVGNLETNVGTLRTDILNLQTVTGNLQTTTTELNTKVGNLTSSFETLNGTVDTHTSKLTEIGDTITNIQSAFDELDGEYVTIDNFNKAVGNIDILLQGQSISSQIEEIRTQLTWQSLV
jgi:chromosome segregation ATPase